METYPDRWTYLDALERRARTPDGFLRSTASLRFLPKEKPASEPYAMNLSLIALERPSTMFAGVFTKNAFPGAPVRIGRERLKGERVRGILVNNRVANVGAPRGLEDAEELIGSLADRLACTSNELFPASTGIIGWSLPKTEMSAALPDLVRGLEPGSLVPVARAIMTTDAYPKVRSVDAAGGRIVGVAKGAGMIEPNLATMLVFLLTDLALPRNVLQGSLARCVERSFNRISVDGDQSTSDTVLLLSSGVRPAEGEEEFERALHGVCSDLAGDIVRNGEGSCHVIRVAVRGELEGPWAVGAAKAVVNSPLVKTAIFGNDPNVGRIITALGDYLGTHGRGLDPRGLTVSLGDVEVFSRGAFRLDRDKEKRLSRYLTDCGCSCSESGFPAHHRTVDITITVGRGAGEEIALGSDLSYGYIKENAEYRS